MSNNNGVQISRDGRNIDGTNPSQMYVHQDFEFLLLHKFVTGIAKFDGTIGQYIEIEIPHTLGYAPFVLAYMEQNPGRNSTNVLFNSSVGAQDRPNILAGLSIKKSKIVISAQTYRAIAGEFRYSCMIYKSRIDFYG